MSTRELNPLLVAMLRCPATGQRLHQVGDRLLTDDARIGYDISAAGIPLFGAGGMSSDARVQEQHYDANAPAYIANLAQPHTREYQEYLDRKLLAAIGAAPLARVAEICCGAGEAFSLLGPRIGLGVGVDVSTAMLAAARAEHTADTRLFIQGDAVRLPLADAQFDTVLMLGGIHHVNDRAALFNEIRRILKPDGCLFWREPVDDFAPWRAARSLIYAHAAALQPDTEHPLRYQQTRQQLERAGLQLVRWETVGFVGYCLLMNSDVLPVNRVWSRIPGVRWLVRLAVHADDVVVRLPGLRRAGVQVIGMARPAASSAV